jgi:hypothetical protein
MDQMKDQDLEKTRNWRKVIREASRSGLSVREFCRRRRLKESQFYLWQRRLHKSRTDHGPATFALVREEPGEMATDLELVLKNGTRIRIGRGVDEATLRTVLATVDRDPC